MEYCDDSDLGQRIASLKKRDMVMEEKEIWNIFGQIVKGLRELHANKVFHRDLKSANIFLNKSGFVKVGDMNVSKISPKGLLYTQTGTPYYASPEVWKDHPYSNKSDIWSLGCILYEMCGLKPPFQADSMEDLYKKVTRGVPDKIPSIYSRELADMIHLMLQVRPSLRPSCDQLLSNPSLQKHLDERFWVEPEPLETPTSLIKTIRMPKNVMSLSEILPPSNYETLRLSNVSSPKGALTSKAASPLKRMSNDLEEKRSESPPTQLQLSSLPVLPRSKNKSLQQSADAAAPDALHPLLAKIESQKLKKRMDQLLLIKKGEFKENAKVAPEFFIKKSRVACQHKSIDRALKLRPSRLVKLDPVLKIN